MSPTIPRIRRRPTPRRVPRMEPLEGRALMSHVPTVHAETAAIRGVYPDPSNSFWNGLVATDGSHQHIPAPGFLGASDVADLRLKQGLHLAPGARAAQVDKVAFVSFGNNDSDQVFDRFIQNQGVIYQGRPLFGQTLHPNGRVSGDLITFVGDKIPAILPGHVVRVSRGAAGGGVIAVRTVFPGGGSVVTTYRHVSPTLRLGAKVDPSENVGLVTRAARSGKSGPAVVQVSARTGAGKTVSFYGTFGYVLVDGHIFGVLPVAQGCGPTFVDTDQPTGGGLDDPDNDADDPGGICR